MTYLVNIASGGMFSGAKWYYLVNIEERGVFLGHSGKLYSPISETKKCRRRICTKIVRGSCNTNVQQGIIELHIMANAMNQLVIYSPCVLNLDRGILTH